MTVEAHIRRKLEDAFSPVALEVVNESHLHSGHQSSPGTGESHFRIKIVSAAFENKKRLERHRLINDVLAEELAGPVHALAISARPAKE